MKGLPSKLTVLLRALLVILAVATLLAVQQKQSFATEGSSNEAALSVIAHGPIQQGKVHTGQSGTVRTGPVVVPKNDSASSGTEDEEFDPLKLLLNFLELLLGLLVIAPLLTGLCLFPAALCNPRETADVLRNIPEVIGFFLPTQNNTLFSPVSSLAFFSSLVLFTVVPIALIFGPFFPPKDGQSGLFMLGFSLCSFSGALLFSMLIGMKLIPDAPSLPEQASLIEGSPEKQQSMPAVKLQRPKNHEIDSATLSQPNHPEGAPKRSRPTKVSEYATALDP